MLTATKWDLSVLASFKSFPIREVKDDTVLTVYIITKLKFCDGQVELLNTLTAFKLSPFNWAVVNGNIELRFTEYLLWAGHYVGTMQTLPYGVMR